MKVSIPVYFSSLKSIHFYYKELLAYFYYSQLIYELEAAEYDSVIDTSYSLKTMIRRNELKRIFCEKLNESKNY